MSRTHRYTDPTVARRRRAMRAATRLIKESWTFTSRFGWTNGRQAREKVQMFRAAMRGRTGEDFWTAVADVRPWLR
jgi:hypothetical protein